MRWNLNPVPRTRRPDDFVLTAAVRPGPAANARLGVGYRVREYRDRHRGHRLPLLSAAAPAGCVFDVFLDLLEPLGPVVHVVLESSHASRGEAHLDLRRDYIDRPVLTSILCEYEDLLLDDGCTGVAVLAVRRPVEVQLDEHKLLHVYAPDLRPFRRVLRGWGIRHCPGLPLISDADHLHCTRPAFAERFWRLADWLGAADEREAGFDRGW